VQRQGAENGAVIYCPIALLGYPIRLPCLIESLRDQQSDWPGAASGATIVLNSTDESTSLELSCLARDTNIM
jgi:hypothetical protein